MKKWLLSFKVMFLSMALLFSFSCGKQPKLPEIPGVVGPIFNIMDGKVMITMKLLKANLNVGARLPIPKTKDSFFEVSPNVEDGGTLIVFYVDVDDLKSIDLGVSQSNTLPDGRAIPGIAGGELHDSVRVDTELLDLSFYFHKKLFGVFMPLGWDTNGMGGYWNVVLNNKNFGLLGLVASDDQGHSAGLILFLRLEALKDRQLKKLIQLSEQNPHLKY